jgi:hypothetical protein
MAREDAAIVQPGPGTTGPSDSSFDGIARLLVAPISRRRALVAAGGAVAAASLLRPTRASADCWPGGPKVCANSHGAKVCVPSDLACCSNENCAIACPYPWRDCAGPAICNDTGRMCFDKTNPQYDPAKTKFCSQTVTVTNGCVDAGQSDAIRGWCCNVAETCGPDFGQCTCPTPCGSDCCKPTQDCISSGLFGFTKTCGPKCPKGWHHDGPDCVCDSGQTCGVRCCPAGSACSGSSCVAPPKTSPSPSGPLDGFKGFFDGINETAASRGNGGARDLHAGAAAAASPVSAALFALGAVSLQGATAATAFNDDHVDSAYRRKVVAARPSPPPINPGTGLDPRAAAALRALVAAEANAFALLLASATALARSRGALRHHDIGSARKQVRAAGTFADKAAKALRGVPALRATAAAALVATGTAEVTATSSQVASLQLAARVHGVPADLRSALGRLGVQGQDLGRARLSLEASAGGGPALIAPLADSARTNNIRAIASGLSSFASSARRQPITHTQPGPKRFRQKVHH